jgi:hypothetical protein
MDYHVTASEAVSVAKRSLLKYRVGIYKYFTEYKSIYGHFDSVRLDGSKNLYIIYPHLPLLL